MATSAAATIRFECREADRQNAGCRAHRRPCSRDINLSNGRLGRKAGTIWKYQVLLAQYDTRRPSLAFWLYRNRAAGEHIGDLLRKIISHIFRKVALRNLYRNRRREKNIWPTCQKSLRGQQLQELFQFRISRGMGRSNIGLSFDKGCARQKPARMPNRIVSGRSGVICLPSATVKGLP